MTHLKSVTLTLSSSSDLAKVTLSFSGLFSLISADGDAGGGTDIDDADAEDVEPVEDLLATADLSFGTSVASLPLFATDSCFFDTSRTAGVVFC